MNETEVSNRGNRGRQVLTGLLLLAIVANLLLTLALHREVTQLGQMAPARPDLPRAAIPTRLVVQEPVCTQVLIEAMNITNVWVLANASLLTEIAPSVATHRQP